MPLSLSFQAVLKNFSEGYRNSTFSVDAESKNTLETLLKVAKIEGEIDRSERKPRTKKLEKSKKVTEVTLVVAYFFPLDKVNNFCLSTIVASLQPVAKTSSEP